MIKNAILYRKDESFSGFLNRAYPKIFSGCIECDPVNAPSMKCKVITF